MGTSTAVGSSSSPPGRGTATGGRYNCETFRSIAQCVAARRSAVRNDWIRGARPPACPVRWPAGRRARRPRPRPPRGGRGRRRPASGACSSRSGSWPGAEDHVVHLEQPGLPRLLSEADGEPPVVDAVVAHPAEHLHLAGLERGPVDPAGGLAQAGAGLGGLALEQDHLPRRGGRAGRGEPSARRLRVGHPPLGHPGREVGAVAAVDQELGDVEADAARPHHRHPPPHRLPVRRGRRRRRAPSGGPGRGCAGRAGPRPWPAPPRRSRRRRARRPRPAGPGGAGRRSPRCAAGSSAASRRTPPCRGCAAPC